MAETVTAADLQPDDVFLGLHTGVARRVIKSRSITLAVPYVTIDYCVFATMPMDMSRVGTTGQMTIIPGTHITRLHHRSSDEALLAISRLAPGDLSFVVRAPDGDGFWL